MQLATAAASENVNNAHYVYAVLFLCSFTHRYQDMYNNPIKATNLEHRDVVLDILSDARVVGPLLQTGMFHADVDRRNYMYVFGHNSATGPYANVSTPLSVCCCSVYACLCMSVCVCVSLCICVPVVLLYCICSLIWA